MDLYYESYGKGHPVVLIHGGGAALREWKFLAPLLAGHYLVIAVDACGVGQFPSPKEKVQYVEDILLLIDELGLERPTLIGHSMGGQVATEFALAYPDRISNLILIAPALSGFQGYTEFERIMNTMMNAAPDLNQMVEVMLNSPLYQVVKQRPERRLAIQMLRDQFLRMFEGLAFQIVWPDPPAIDRLKDLRSKTLFLIGQKDLAENFIAAEHFREITNIKFVKIPGADHMLTLTHSEDLYQEIIAFMEE